jgi:NADH:ubiquinone oxidoreductase subunit H
MKSYRDYFKDEPQRVERLDRILYFGYRVLLVVALVNFVAVLVIATK